jgi:hypothetical protein
VRGVFWMVNPAVTCCEWIKRQRLMCESRCPIVTTSLPEECPRSCVSVCRLGYACACAALSRWVRQNKETGVLQVAASEESKED